MNFKSDNTAPAAPEILAALSACNEGAAASYGEDAWTARVNARLSALFEADVEVFLVATGTAANALALASMTPPWGSILCHREAHIETDEAGAPEFFTAGAKLVLIDGPHAKIAPDGLEEALTRNRRGVHSVHPGVVSISNATERGAVYAPDEVAALAAIAHREGIGLHMDGARFANAVAHLGCAPRALTKDAGVDVLSFGATKNGALGVEAIVVFDRARARDIPQRRKRAGHLFSKHRYLAAQMLAYLENDLWLVNARRANGLAQAIADAAGAWVSAPVQSNHVFIRPGAATLAALRAAGAEFYEWGAPGSGEARLVVSYSQPEEEVGRLCEALRRLRA
ncbi:MAG: low specificity L-threonine aldolase [Hydrogenophilaceae bacterium]|jgi:threonine aldolase|nr:low specificity L-threonine aldolase [Hydrogenophilaceae bacterium]